MITPREQNARHNHNIQMVNKSYDNVAKFESLGKTLTNQKSQSWGKQYLGLHFDRRLNWKVHITKKRKQTDLKAKEINWLIGKNPTCL